MKSPNNGGVRTSQLDISCDQMKHPVWGLGYNQLNYWPKKPHRNPKQPRLLPRQ